MIRFAATILAAAAILAACTTDATPTEGETVPGASVHEKISFAGKRATSAERKKCEAAGGEVGPGGMLGYDQCVQVYSDAGEACRTFDDCEGRCLLSADSEDEAGQPTDDGVCQTTDSPFGCYTEVNDGRVQWAICVD